MLRLQYQQNFLRATCIYVHLPILFVSKGVEGELYVSLINLFKEYVFIKSKQISNDKNYNFRKNIRGFP